MTDRNNLYCLILAGGKGRRLWPFSRVKYPKQFIDFFGVGRTQLQQTFDRISRLLPADHVFISTSVNYVSLVKEQLPSVPDCNILAEPLWRNTAPSICWGAHRIYNFNHEASIIVMPSDQQVINEDLFCQDVARGHEYVDTNKVILTLGVKATRPDPGYGYIQVADEEKQKDVYAVKSFTEKPDREFAQMFIDSGEFYWNTSIFMSKAEYLLSCFDTLLPAVLRKIDTSADDFSVDDENRYMLEHFPSYPNISIEQGIMEKSDNVDVMTCHFGWADMSTWHGMYEATSKLEGDNVVLDSDVILDNSTNNIIKVEKGHLAVINGLSGYIVVEKDDILLICPKEDSSALIRKYSTEVDLRR